MSAIRRVLREEMGGFLLRLSLANLLVSGVPRGGGGRIRSWIYRVIGGLAIGRGTVIMGAMKLHGGAGASRRLQIGAYGFINEGVEFDLGGTIKIGEGVSLGMGCLFLTVSHAVGDAGFRAGLREIRPVTIGRGAWLGARVMVLPGTTVGPGAIIGAGAVVTRDVAADILAAGVPARAIRELPA